MEPPRTLTNPPITEALIDFRVDEVPLPAEADLHRLKVALAEQYPHVRDQHSFEARLDFPAEAVPTLQAAERGATGLIFSTAGREQLAQFRRDGFTLNRLAPYTSWESLRPEAERLWGRFLEGFRPRTVRRLAVRYINRIPLAGSVLALAQQLASPVPTPIELVQSVASFVTSVVLHDVVPDTVVRVTQTVEPDASHGLSLLLDIDAHMQGEWEPADPVLARNLERLREVKNRVFFSSLSPTLLAQFE